MAIINHFTFDLTSFISGTLSGGVYINTINSGRNILTSTAGDKSFPSGKINQAMQFGGFNFSGNAYNSSVMFPSSGGATIAFWFYGEQNDVSIDPVHPLLKVKGGSQGTGNFYLKFYSSGGLGGFMEISDGSSGSLFFSAVGSGVNYWNNCIISTDGTNWTTYINNIQQTPTGTTFLPTFYNNTDFIIDYGTDSYTYAIDDLRIYDTAINSSERAFIFNLGSGTQADSGGTPVALTAGNNIVKGYSTKPIYPQPSIVILNSGGTLESTATNTVYASVVSGSATIGGSTNVAAVNGVATFSGLTLTGFGSVGLKFTASGLSGTFSPLFNITNSMPVMPIRSENAGVVPTSGNLQIGELAINIADQKGYVKKSDGTIVTVFQAGGSITSGQITSGYIGNNAVVSGSIASGSIVQYHMSSGYLLSLIRAGVALGWGAGGQITDPTSAGNLFIGTDAGLEDASGNSVTSINDSTIIGQGAKVLNTSGDVAEIVIGAYSYGFGSYTTAIGNESTMSGKIYGNINFPHGLYWHSGYISSGGPLISTFGSGVILSGNIANAAVVSGSIASGQVGQFHLSSGSVTSGAIASGQVGQFHLSSGSVTSGAISSGVVGINHLSNGSVRSGAIASGQVGQFQLANNSVYSGAIASGQIDSPHIASGAIKSYHLSSGAILSGSNAIGIGAITSGQIASGLLGGGVASLTSGQITSGFLGNASVVSGSIASGQIGLNHLASGVAVGGGPATITSGQITSGFLGNASVVSGSIASGTLGTFHFSSGAVLSGNISSGQIGINHLGSGAVSSGAIASGSISQFKLSSGTVNSGQLGNNAVVSGSIASGQIDSPHIASGAIKSYHLSSGAILSGSNAIGIGAITSGQIASGLLGGGVASLTSGQITSGYIGNNAVVSGSIASGQIDSPHIASGAIKSYHLSSGAILSGSNAIGIGAITSGQIASGLLGGGVASLTSGQITSGYIGNNAVVSGSIASGQISLFAIGSGAVGSGRLGASSVNSGNIASGQIFNLSLGSGAIRSGAIASGQIGNNHFGNGAVRSGAIASGQIGQTHIADNAVASGNIASGSISQNHLYTISYPANGYVLTTDGTNFDWALPTAFLSSGSVVSGNIGDNAVTFGNIASGLLLESQTITKTTFLNNFRIGLQSGVAVNPDNTTSGAVLYLNPYDGWTISLYNGNEWTQANTSGTCVNLDVGGSVFSGKNYDVFAYVNSGYFQPNLELSAEWTTASTRYDPIYFLDGIPVKSGDFTRRLVGTVRAIQDDVLCDSLQNRLVSNINNKVRQGMFYYSPDGPHTFNTTSGVNQRIWANNSGNQITWISCFNNSNPGMACHFAGLAKTGGIGGIIQNPTPRALAVSTAFDGSYAPAILIRTSGFSYGASPSTSLISTIGLNYYQIFEGMFGAVSNSGIMQATDLIIYGGVDV